MHFSVSQIKMFMKSPSQRAGQNILKIKDEFINDSYEIGKAFHFYCQNRKDPNVVTKAYEMLKEVQKPEEAVRKLDNLIKNYDAMGIKLEGQNEVGFKKEIFTYPFVGYLDNVEEAFINELKSASSFTKKDDLPAMRQAVNSYEEYALQAWLYMKATDRNLVRLIEVLNIDTSIPPNTTITKDALIEFCKDFAPEDTKLTKQAIVEKYKPQRVGSQIIYFSMTPEFDKEMTEKYRPIIEEMFRMTLKYRQAPLLIED